MYKFKIGEKVRSVLANESGTVIDRCKNKYRGESYLTTMDTTWYDVALLRRYLIIKK
jgi:hypothetical protein